MLIMRHLRHSALVSENNGGDHLEGDSFHWLECLPRDTVTRTLTARRRFPPVESDGNRSRSHDLVEGANHGKDELMALECTLATEWIEEEVSKPIEEWEERQEERCKEYPWYDPRGWVCWFVTIFVKVVRWVVVTVGKWVTRTVCKFVTVFIQLLIDVVAGLWDIVAGIFTLDWRRILDGLIRIGLGVLFGVIRLLRIVLLGDTFQFIIEEINKGRLKEHVRRLLQAKYGGDTLDQIKDAIRLDHGAFGLRLTATAFRTVLDSEATSPTEPGVPNLVVLHESGAINLRELCGFAFPQGFWNRKRYKTMKKGAIITGGGGGEFDNPISEVELDEYLNSRGADGPAYIVLPMRDAVLETKLRTAQEKGRELGLILSWERTSVEVTQADHIVRNGFDTGLAGSSQVRFLIDIIGRTDKTVNDAAAAAELCRPVAVGVFRYTDTLRGIASLLRPSECGLSGSNASGVTFIDNIPDHIWKYVLMHELGHYFGLCHVDGFDRIMVSTRQNSWWSWMLLPNWLYLSGEPIFIFDEAKGAWDYIVEHFPPECLGAQRADIG